MPIVTIASEASWIEARSRRWYSASSPMNGSAGSTAMTASAPARRAAATAPSPTAGAVLRGMGSAMTFSAGSSGTAARICAS